MRDRNDQNGVLVDRIVRGICRRGGVEGGEAERLAAFVRRELGRDDGALLRAHDGQSSQTAYLTIVIHRLLAREGHVGRVDAPMRVALMRRLRRTGKNDLTRHTDMVEIRA